MLFSIRIVLIFGAVIGDAKFLRKSSIVWPGLDFVKNENKKIEGLRNVNFYKNFLTY